MQRTADLILRGGVVLRFRLLHGFCALAHQHSAHVRQVDASNVPEPSNSPATLRSRSFGQMFFGG
eukprot:214532-Prymnesium_polylepis.1